jgi:Ca2+-binding EF-hand superfamily protein
MRIFFSAVSALVFLAGAALSAQQQQKGQGIDPDQLQQMFMRLDTNKDGDIDREEVPDQAVPRFEQLLRVGDTNKNGRLERQELAALVDRAKGKAQGGQSQLQRIAAMDTNKDGRVSKEEFTLPPAMFERIDRNKDGFLTPDEVREALGKGGAPKPDPTMPPPKPSTGLTPLTQLGDGFYESKPGGLYPGGKNERPPAHEEAGLRFAKSVVPLNAKGDTDDSGKIVLLSIGMSNATQEFSVFKRMADGDVRKNPKVVIVDGAQGGMTAAVIMQTETPRGMEYWDKVNQLLERALVTPAQVQAVWLKEADAQPTGNFPEYAENLERELERIAQILKERFPNLKLLYNSSRIYGGWAVTRLNPEPYAYESGFSVKWLIEKQIHFSPDLNYDPARGPVKACWLSWGPYLWADGEKARPDGLKYVQSDFGPDGTHPSDSGRQKVAKLLLDFFKNDTTTRGWFVREKGSGE